MGNVPHVIAVIPARFASTRLPAKPLADIHGKPMIQWVYERTRLARGLSRVIVATDHSDVANAVRRFGGEVVMTSPEIASGTDRMAAVADQVRADFYVNVQGDEPMMDPAVIEKTTALVTSGRFPLGTAMSPIRSREELHNPAVVKVIADRNGRAIYFSRHPIPYSRGPEPKPGEGFACLRHVGLYAYERETLLKFRSLPSASIEKAEMLEQLRALENGIPIGIVEVDFTAIGVDTPEDLEKVRSLLI